MSVRTRIFISYSHDSEPHVQFVLDLAERLIEDGFNCVLDFYLDEAPAEGWQAWLATELAEADYTLVICTSTYLERYQQGAVISSSEQEFQGLVITADLYSQFAKQTKFIPILPEAGKLQDIIPPLQGQNAFELMADYLGLHQLLKNKQPKAQVVEPEPVKWQDEASQAARSAPVPPKPADTIDSSARQGAAKNQQLMLYAALAVLALFVLVAIAFALF